MSWISDEVARYTYKPAFFVLGLAIGKYVL